MLNTTPVTRQPLAPTYDPTVLCRRRESACSMAAASLRTGKIKHDHLQPHPTMTPKEFFEFAKKNDAKQEMLFVK